MTVRGAPAAYRGYRLQALYVLKRILTSNDKESLIFHPEGFEDLDLEEINGHLIESVQVKSYGNLVLSDLSPEKSSSFFNRALRMLKSTEPPKIVLVNFGLFGEEIHLAWQGNEKQRQRISNKLKGFNFKDEDILSFFKFIELIELDEIDIIKEVHTLLQNQVVGVDPKSAFDLLLYWLYIQSENQSRLTYKEIILEIQNVGRFLSERFQHQQEWFTSIQPIEDRPANEKQIAHLREEFYNGVSARYEHILASLDFRRDQKMMEISKGFEQKNVVIIHGASGQGKSTLAYRFLHDGYPDYWRFSIQIVESRQHALKIAAALAGHANAIQAPIVVFIDVSPSDSGWIDLISQISHFPFMQILIAIREEDYHRANLAETFDYVPVNLTFDKEEAKLIYERAQTANLHVDILTFDDAWHSFGNDGPLMEFVYLLTQTETLHKRLEGQINRLRNEVREKNLSPDELHLLRLVTVATTFDVHLSIPGLLAILNLPEPSLTLDLFEKEYLLRITSDRTYISGLHPIRSRIISQILIEPEIYRWEDAINQILPIIQEEDWESFILQSFIDHPESFQEILNIVTGIKPKSWTGLVGILRCLLWAGVKKYVEENWDQVISAKELFGPAWYFILDLNFIGEEAVSLEGWWKNFGELLTEEKILKIEQIRQSQTPKENAFQYGIRWLNSIKDNINIPISDQDWEAIPEVLYWSYRWGLSEKVSLWISNETLFSAESIISIENLSELFLGIYLTNKQRYFNWMNASNLLIEEKVAQELNIIALEDKENIFFIHFLTYPEETPDKNMSMKVEAKSIHEKTIESLQIVRQLFPNFEKYGSQGYGHQITGLGFDHDDSKMNGLDKKYLIPKWPIRLNGIAIGLIQYNFRFNRWEDYFHHIIQTRKLLVTCFSQLIPGITHYFAREKPLNFLRLDVFQNGDWDKLIKQIENIPLLPKSAVDPWGMAQPEGKAIGNHLNLQDLLPASILDQIYKPFLEEERKFFSSMENFMGQAIHVIITNFKAGKFQEGSPQKAFLLQQLSEENIKTNLDFLSFFLFIRRERVFIQLPELFS